MRYEVRSSEGQDFGTEMLVTLQELERRAGITLSPFEKVLLAEVATVEQVLSIIAGCSITVRPLAQHEEPGGILVRRAGLLGEGDDVLLTAESRIHTELLPPPVHDDLVGGRGGIGTILRRYSIETLRRVDHVGYDDETGLLYRRYFIVHGGAILFDIHEEFARGRF